MGAYCSAPSTPHNLPPAAEEAKTAGNHSFFEHNYAMAVKHYTAALRCTADAAAAAPVLISRAAALLERKWEGDAWFALQVRAASCGFLGCLLFAPIMKMCICCKDVAL